MQQVVINTDGKIVPEMQATSKHKKMSLKEFVCDFKPRLDERINRGNETLESKITDLKEFTIQTFNQVNNAIDT